MPAFWDGDLVRDGCPPPEAWPAEAAIAWSGSLAAGPGRFVPEPRNWMGPGRAALESACDRLVDGLARSRRTLLLRPHARQVLSDLTGAVDFLRRHRGERFGLAFAPADLFVASMLNDAAEHLGRGFAVLLPLLRPDRDVLILEDLEPPDREEDLPRKVPLGTGILPWQTVASAVGSLGSAWRVVLPGEADSSRFGEIFPA